MFKVMNSALKRSARAVSSAGSAGLAGGVCTVSTVPRRLRSTNVEQGTLNIPSKILELRTRKLHWTRDNPVGIIKHELETYFHKSSHGAFEILDNLSDKVPTSQNFEELLVPKDDSSRLLAETYYFDPKHVLRPHTCAHQTELLKKGCKSFLVSGDCFRKDTIDATHYPVFHQMEGTRLWYKRDMTEQEVEKDLKLTVEKMVQWMFPFREFRWRQEDDLTRTQNAWQMDIRLDDDRWLEILSCGLIHKQILKNCELSDHFGWTFGVGLERLAMALFDIDDIRQFWSQDERYLSQFSDGRVRKFVPYTKNQKRSKNIAFWLDSEKSKFHENDFMDMIRNVAGDYVQSVALVDEFEHTRSTSRRVTKSYEINYKHNDRIFTNEEVNKMQRNLRDSMEKGFGAEVLGY